MSLLLQAMEEPLDPGYAQAAQDRREGRMPSRRRRLLVAGLAAALGAALVTEAVQVLRRPEPSAARARAVLEREVAERTDRLDALATRVQQLQGEVASAQEQLSAPEDVDPLQPLARLAGEVPLEGPGVELVVDDTQGGEDRERVYDRDLQLLVNGLWAAGAEAVAVNDQRVTALTAIRSAGEAVLVGFRPLQPPYVVEALGDPQDLQAGFVAGPGGAVARSLQENYGIQVSLSRQESVDVPAAEGLRLRVAEPLAEADPSLRSTPAAEDQPEGGSP